MGAFGEQPHTHTHTLRPQIYSIRSELSELTIRLHSVWNSHGVCVARSKLFTVIGPDVLLVLENGHSALFELRLTPTTERINVVENLTM